MSTDEALHFELPVNAALETAVSVLVKATLDRVGGVRAAGAIAATVMADLQTPIADAIQRGRSGETTVLTLTLLVEAKPRRLCATISGLLRSEVALPPPAGDGQEYTSGDITSVVGEPGVGLLVIRRLMDDVDYTPQAGGNHWRLTKSLPSAALVGISANSEKPRSESGTAT